MHGNVAHTVAGVWIHEGMLIVNLKSQTGMHTACARAVPPAVCIDLFGNGRLVSLLTLVPIRIHGAELECTVASVYDTWPILGAAVCMTHVLLLPLSYYDGTTIMHYSHAQPQSSCKAHIFVP